MSDVVLDKKAAAAAERQARAEGARQRGAAEATRLLEQAGLRGKLGAWLLKG